MLRSPYLLTASLALSAAGCLSRGMMEIDGIEIPRLMEHLQSSGLSLLQAALSRGQKDELLLVTCLIWCLADVFAGQQGLKSWHIHLQGVKAILDASRACQKLVATTASTRSAIRHLYLLYLSLQRLPCLSSLTLPTHSAMLDETDNSKRDELFGQNAQIDGFLGYSEDLLKIIDRINQIYILKEEGHQSVPQESEILLERLKAMIELDSLVPPQISISTTLSHEDNLNFILCHKSFQQATLIHLYRRLYDMPSGSPVIQSAVVQIISMVENMTQGQPCNTWVAMSMPLFTIGCEVVHDDQKVFVLDMIKKLETCLGSLHVRILRQALKDIWEARAQEGDFGGYLCANHLLSKSFGFSFLILEHY